MHFAILAVSASLVSSALSVPIVRGPILPATTCAGSHLGNPECTSLKDKRIVSQNGIIENVDIPPPIQQITSEISHSSQIRGLESAVEESLQNVQWHQPKREGIRSPMEQDIERRQLDVGPGLTPDRLARIKAAVGIQ
ncbi:hypothetical protein PLICRDRAFT_701802 [Plicaturopsis crispa FD-325 SS-3]|uniref:Uncharacterized protein n=1 Tax=Plicaturopsis crispa FD-325 SS-3 TaxID=944288 RepID=A0A0C9SXW3_PLICR|nr:hypothetical protein PLICRDRAFT_701802 [Plicaturopsis crispa FD-325 SS-3]